MRELKFRYWNGEKMEEIKLGESWYDMPKELHIMQFTGLKDKNDKEIYEGDIIKEEYGSSVIDFHNGSFMRKTDSGFYVLQNTQYIEILGNIYEFRNLLT
jgi:uncharacterized phage protein (TIGR01671 family)